MDARERVLRAERRHGALLDNALDVVSLCSAENAFLYVSPSVEDVLGYAPEELVGTTVSDLVHPDDLAGYVRDVIEGIRVTSGPFGPVEARYRHRDGSWRYLETTLNVLLDDPEVGGVVCVSRDVTGRRRLEDELRGLNEGLEGEVARRTAQIEAALDGLGRSEERFRATFEQAAVGMAHVGMDGGWLRVNRKLCEIVGYPREELLGKTFQDITHPEDLGADLDQLRWLLAGEIGTYSMEKRYFRKDGPVVWVNLTVSLVRGDRGEPDYFISVIEDIFGRKLAEETLRESEQRHRAVVEQSAEGLYLLDAATRRITETNPSLQRMLGYSGEELEGMELYDLVGLPQEQVDETLRRTLESGHRPVGERRYRRRDGSLVDVEVTASVIRPGGREVVCALVRDITERKRAEAALREIREGERARMARDLHDGALQDLTYALLEAQVVRMLNSNPDLEGRLTDEIEALKSTERRLRAAVYDLRLGGEMGKSLTGLLEALVEESRQMSPGYEVRLAVGGGLPEASPGEAGVEVLRVLREALSNARRHSAATRVLVSVGESELVAEVLDDGRGFVPGGPSGVGLKSMRERAAALEGTLEVDSEPGAGTRVRLRVPLPRLWDGDRG